MRPQLAESVIANTLGLELALDEIQGALRPIDEDEPARAEREDLAGQLGADRATGAGDEHDPVADRLVDGGRVLGRRRPAEEVLHLDPADAIGVESAVEQVAHGRHGPDVQAARERGVDDLSDRWSRERPAS